ncbi:MAG: ribonuclease P protein component [Mangrovibacterium sp.]|jgi:ribonuclease P protein component
MKSFSLTKEERLSSRKAIERLFLEGDSFFIFPIKVVYLRMELAAQYPVQAAFSVSKKNFKRAVMRNLLKRRMREAYRLNKGIVYQVVGRDRQLAVMFIYAGREEKEYELIEKSMKQALFKLAKMK